MVIKIREQQDLAMVHGVPQSKVDGRTALINRIRGYLAERGMVIPKSAHQVRKHLPSILGNAEKSVVHALRALFAERYQTLVAMDNAIKAMDRRINALCRKMP